MLTEAYDAWGNVTKITGNKTLAKQNPFRYRSYYYDEELGLYYLQSRYYDSQVGRFINADDVNVMATMQKGLKGSNLFEYCENNAVNKKDPTGYLSINKNAIKKALLCFISVIVSFKAFIDLMIRFFKWVVQRPLIRGILDGMKIARSGATSYEKGLVIGMKIQNTINRWRTALRTAWYSLSKSIRIGIVVITTLAVTIICYSIYKCRRR